MAKILVSACLLGLAVRYDGKSKAVEKIIELSKDNTLIPVCPEQLGGLPTPRLKCEIKDKHVIRVDGEDVTANYLNGAHLTLDIAKLNKVDYCILKSKSPSCGKGLIYDGNFNGRLIDGDGLTCKLLKENGFVVYSEEDIINKLWKIVLKN